MYRGVVCILTSLQVKEKDIQSYIDKGYKFGLILKKKYKKKKGDISE